MLIGGNRQTDTHTHYLLLLGMKYVDLEDMCERSGKPFRLTLKLSPEAEGREVSDRAFFVAPHVHGQLQLGAPFIWESEVEMGAKS